MGDGYTRGEVAADLREMGLRTGDGVVVHSSLSSIGWVEGGAGTVVDALLDVVGTAGTVMVPTFTGSRPGDPFDPAETPSTTGAVTEALRTRSGAHRSRHPTHSVAAVGDGAAELVADHDRMESVGPGSPLHRLLDRGGDVLLLGVDHTANSSIHVAEKLAGVPYRDRTRESAVIEDGRERRVTVNAVHCSHGFEKVAPVLGRTDHVEYGPVGEAESRLVDGAALLDVLVGVLEEHPGFLLCDRPDCERCTGARRAIADSADAGGA